MYDLDLETAAPKEIIRRSAICHPTLFRDALFAAAKVHWDYSTQTHDAKAATVALDMANNLRRMGDELNMDDFDADNLSYGETIQALNVACRLQCIPWAVRTKIVLRS